MMNVAWNVGGEAVVVDVLDLHVTVRSSRPFPPGAPAQGVLHGDPSHPFTLKIAGSRRDGELFVVRGRLISATVAVRDAFAACMRSSR